MKALVWPGYGINFINCIGKDVNNFFLKKLGGIENLRLTLTQFHLKVLTICIWFQQVSPSDKKVTFMETEGNPSKDGT